MRGGGGRLIILAPLFPPRPDVPAVTWRGNNKANLIQREPTHLVPSLAGALDLVVVALGARGTRPRALPQEEEGAAVAGSRRAPTAAGETTNVSFFLRYML